MCFELLQFYRWLVGAQLFIREDMWVGRLVSARTGLWGAAIAKWIRLCLPSCRPGFESQANHLSFYFTYSQICAKLVIVL